MPKIYSLIIILILMAAGVGGFFIWRDLPVRQAGNLENESPSAEGNSAPPGSSKPGFETAQKPGFFPPGGFESGELETLAKQSLDRKIPAGDEAVAKELSDLSLELSREPNYLQGWLQVGVLRKFLKDYEGASLAWQYASVLRPEDHIALNNLGDLYHYYLKDFAKAEKYMRQAISAKPDFIPGYKNLHDLYVFSYKEKADLADDILLEGIRKNPNDYYLRVILASYYKDQGDKTNARKYYEEALTLNPPNKDSILQELAGFDKE
ncbi:hypothetical protein A2926_01525 [Candidatus Giovannonibacteria bacterium RIFCSPLOWO2_01_FULL_44_40]|uniref:Uncharacterized protein n=1 Tax=Candidatus Giovannonibacteria bacterium RIFCSPHIGHO2_01_FULL_45_23 TaxID=1798325 RepID=A0A1F5VF01_9BACT|nr:MAG: hypothetical protein A2834_01715 [Candidatus Giovannonibacteria bacterium RIFCSPHIGHO2_01_FULL_45_23]OGF75133.1 MAG: hypothetical protein A3C77_01155 [Candidatus Giovannonibacteria bacterium RIFCSPHIGHO2_02_FULL_45_13]OGF79674.1 MAG: hypothetical protein A2926_01525 [Candidatus Giovannonibacteria bacterium RIFCSPLOWO2_01_FULL_44_40]